MAKKEQGTTAVAGTSQSQQFVPSFGSFVIAASQTAAATEVSLVTPVLDQT